MFPLQTSNPTTVSPEKCNIVEEHYKDFKITIINMFENLKEVMNISINKTYEDKEWVKWKKQFKT